MENNLLVERLSLQAESFQEGFKILIQSGSFNELVKNFRHLLRANFIITNLHLLHKKSYDSNWKIIAPSGQFDESDITLLNHQDQQSLIYYGEKKYNAVIILPLSDSSYLGILLGNRLDGSAFSDFDKITLQILLQVFSSAYESFLNQQKEKKLIFELNEKVMQLSNLIDTGIEISRFDKHNILFEMAIERMVSLTNSSSALVSISEIDGNTRGMYIIFPVAVPVESILDSPYKIESSFEFRKKIYRFILSEKETRRGVTHFNDLDKLLLEAITRQVKAGIENDYLLKESIEKEQMEKEIRIAAAIQQRIIPKELPRIEGFELSGINIPSKEVGGDYYDCIDIGNGKYALIIADVTGKGIGAALLVNTLNAALYSYLEFQLPLTEMTDKLNKLIYNSSPSDKFITFFIAVLDSKTGNLDVVNAGHNPVLLLRKDGRLEKIEAGGIGLGMLDLGIPYQGQTLIMNPDDRLFLYTDGIPEAMNKNEEEYSDPRMIDFFVSNSDCSASEFIQAIVKDVNRHVDGAPQSDDITSLFLKRI
ncbi:MAG TPA: PP2C family protein-serine/threonine phosphatase [Ignavibacteriaceae bacterium]|nr:PP2C family protein-serine/threonine phosphatase [Ignavibacteriaceae bacterium]